MNLTVGRKTKASCLSRARETAVVDYGGKFNGVVPKISSGEMPCFVMMKTSKGCAFCCTLQFPNPNEFYNRCLILCHSRWGELD